MADQRGAGIMAQPQHQDSPLDARKGLGIVKLEKGPSAAQVLAVAALLPFGGFLLALSGLTLTGTVIALALATPLFVLFSPILVPAAIVIGLAVTGFLASGAFGVTALSALAWIINALRGAITGEGGRAMQDQLEHARRRMGEAAGQVAQKAKDAGQKIEGKAQDVAGRT